MGGLEEALEKRIFRNSRFQDSQQVSIRGYGQTDGRTASCFKMSVFFENERIESISRAKN